MADEQTTAPESAGTSEAAATQNTQATTAAIEEEEFNPERAKALISKLREQEKAGKAAQKELASIKAKAAQDEADRLKAAGDYKALLDASEAKVRDLEPVTTERDRYKGVVESLLQVERKGLPKHITALLDKLDPVDQLAWIAENRESVAAPKAPNVNATDGRQGGTPAPDYGAMSKDEFAAIYGVKPKFLK